MTQEDIAQKLKEFIETLDSFVAQKNSDIDAKLTLLEDKLKEVEALKIKTIELSELEQKLTEERAFIEKEKELDRSRKQQLDIKEKQLNTQKAQLQNLIDSM